MVNDIALFTSCIIVFSPDLEKAKVNLTNKNEMPFYDKKEKWIECLSK